MIILGIVLILLGLLVSSLKVLLTDRVISCSSWASW